MAKYIFERHFVGNDQKNVILAPRVDCHDPVRIVSREPNIHSSFFPIMLKSFPSMSLLIRSKVDKINSLLITFSLDFYHGI